MKILHSVAALIALSVTSAGALAADPCSFKWNAAHEVQLFSTTPLPTTAAAEAGKAPMIANNKLLALTLHPQQQVRYVVPPTKQMLADGAFGGLLKFTVDKAGPHRIAIDAGFWLDVVHQGKALEAADFNGSRECTGPRKIVVYELPAGAELTLQIAAATSAAARLTVTPAASPVQ